MADGHDAWYRRELNRGRRFHGAFAGGFSAGYHNTVGSAEGWQPASFRSSRTKRQRVAGARPEEIGDAEDGLLGRTVAVGAGYGSRAGDAASPATAGARAPSEAPHRHGARLVRLLRRRRKRRRYATGAGEEDEGDRAPLSRAAAVPMLDGARFCVGYDGALERSSGARAGRDVYRVDDVLGGAGGGRATRTPALRDASGAAPRGHHSWSRRLCRRGPSAQVLWLRATDHTTGHLMAAPRARTAQMLKSQSAGAPLSLDAERYASSADGMREALPQPLSLDGQTTFTASADVRARCAARRELGGAP